METTKFNVGDRVRRRKEYSWHLGSDVLTIKSIERDGYMCTFKELVGDFTYILGRFEKVEDAPTFAPVPAMYNQRYVDCLMDEIEYYKRRYRDELLKNIRT